MTHGGLFVFWDNSNIYIEAQKVAKDKDGLQDTRPLRIHFQNLLDLVRVGRKIEYGIAVGSIPPELREVWANLRKTGITVELFERGGATKKEQGVDQCLQVHMLRVLSDYAPSVAVLLTGDGSGYADGVGFFADLERMQKKGWGIEVLSWDRACNKKLREWAGKVGAYVALEDHYDQVTFIEGERKQKPVRVQNRTVATPRKTTPAAPENNRR